MEQQYTEISCNFDHTPTDAERDMLTGYLMQQGFDSFADIPEGLLAYIPTSQYAGMNPQNIAKLLAEKGINVLVEAKLLENINWNEEWEKNFPPVIIDNKCIIKASFHSGLPDYQHTIIINPKMSFGTGHHETTSLMVSEIMKLNLANKRVLDMGCGTGILAILASKLKAKEIVAIDNDDWAYENTCENCKINSAYNIQVILGEASSLAEHLEYDIILANINRNILLADMPKYCAKLKSGGILLLSGILKTDFEIIAECGKNLSLILENTTEKNKWMAIRFAKPL